MIIAIKGSAFNWATNDVSISTTINDDIDVSMSSTTDDDMDISIIDYLVDEWLR